MRVIYAPWILTFIVAVAFSCEDNDCCLFKSSEANLVEGKWRLFEEGYSPGTGYIINSVPANPEQFMILRDQKRFFSNMEGWREVKDYWIFYDTLQQVDVLAFYKDGIFSEQPNLADADATYTMIVSGDTLSLGYRYCFEGCHLRFKRVD